MLDLGGNSLGNIEIIIKSYGLKYPYILLVKPIKSKVLKNTTNIIGYWFIKSDGRNTPTLCWFYLV